MKGRDQPKVSIWSIGDLGKRPWTLDPVVQNTCSRVETAKKSGEPAGTEDRQTDTHTREQSHTKGSPRRKI